ncbi:MAG: carbonic anhydrase [Planctomycetaceae bacterium]|jgi:carbonic anhydrase|nr:carbonic anhydrase [Planctomycetaceae bacterium]
MKTKTIILTVLFLQLVTLFNIAAIFGAEHQHVPALLPAEAVKLLQEGNARFVAGTPQHPHFNLEQVKETAEHGQHPFVTILACSDSRVPLTVIFDRGIGDIFSVQAAGNVSGSAQLGSIEYGVAHAGTPLVVVLGHTKCGAVTAACTDGGHEGHIEYLVQKINPAVRQTQLVTGKTGKDIIESTCQNNVFLQIEALKTNSKILSDAVKNGEIIIVGAIYDIETGKVTFLETSHKPIETPLKKSPRFRSNNKNRR